MKYRKKNRATMGNEASASLDLRSSFLDYGKRTSEQKGSYYPISNVLLDTYTKQRKISNETKASAAIQYVDENDKPTSITPFQMKLLLNLLPDVAECLKDEEIRTGYIANLPEKVRYGVVRASQKQVEPPTIKLNLTQFAKKYYGTNRVGTKNIDNIFNELIKMSRSRIKFVIKSKEHGKTIEREFTAPLIGNVQTYKEAENGKRVKNGVLLTISDAMLYGLDQAGLFQIAPTVLAELISIANNNTEIFLKLLFQLISVRGYRVNNANVKEREKRKELQDKGVTDVGTIEAEAAAARAKELTYEEARKTILQRLDGGTYWTVTNGKRYMREAKLDKDIKKAADDLRDHIRIIKKYKVVPTADNDKKIVFALNDKWAEDAEKYLAERAKK